MTLLNPPKARLGAGRAAAALPGAQVQLTFGASGLPKDRIAGGEANDVFVSANLAHPQARAAGGGCAAAQHFARNTVCVLARPGLDVSSAALLDRVRDLALKLATSTPRADPSGDYAWQVFDRLAPDGRPGAAAALKGRALQLARGPASPVLPDRVNVAADYGLKVRQGAPETARWFADHLLSAEGQAVLARHGFAPC